MFDFLLEGLKALTWQQAVMWIIGGILIYLAIKKDMEPALLLPMGFGAILVNLPLSPVIGSGQNGEHLGIISSLFKVGIEASEAMPLLLFIGIGCMIDFGPLLTNPKLFILGGAAQLGIFVTIILAAMIGFPLNDAAAIGIIGAADGPTAIVVANKLNSQFMGPIMGAAYSYMALVPIIQPPVIKAMTTKKERMIRMPYKQAEVSKTTRILFPIVITIVAGLVAPASVALVGFLMHADNITMEQLKKDIIENVINKVIPNNMIDEKTNIYINPTGRFVIGGPLGDTGLTGRKIIVDTYGGYARHGGGAFSGKDATKVDRSAAYMLRHIAKNIVANGYAEKCEIQVAYSIGMKEPLSIWINTFGTNKIEEEEIISIIKEKFNLTPKGIIDYLDLKKPIYTKTTNYGHFGKNDLEWEKIINI